MGTDIIRFISGVLKFAPIIILIIGVVVIWKSSKSKIFYKDEKRGFRIYLGFIPLIILGAIAIVENTISLKKYDGDFGLWSWIVIVISILLLSFYYYIIQTNVMDIEIAHLVIGLAIALIVVVISVSIYNKGVELYESTTTNKTIEEQLE
ncbi:hypothetical protein [Staphylococcus shinii]|uniref:hypothetical protein n=1 Tax=Staphylococcus shinii TaxID=2912228 RepID=UPI003F56B228